MPVTNCRHATEPSCLFPEEAEIARLVLGPRRAKAWSGLAVVLERRGLPRIDPQFGGRYWPKVRRFLDRMQHLDRDEPVPVEHKEPRALARTGGVRPRSGSAA